MRAISPDSLCFHCGLPVPASTHFAVTWQGVARNLCCRGCQAVAQAILASGLHDYYRLRTAHAPSRRDLVPAALHDLAAYDHPAVQKSFVRALGTRREAALILDDVACAVCMWLNERNLRRLPGVEDVQMNYAARRARVTWDDSRITLSRILQAIRDIGYDAHPFDPAHSQERFQRERRGLLYRFGIAGIFGAQVMTLGVALYLGDWGGTDPKLRDFFYWVSLLLTLPVLGYSAQPFFRGAWNDLRHRRAGMDVPIALGLAVAFAASVWTTVTGQGAAYYDSVTMFVFLLLGGRLIELNARARANEAAEALVQATPAIASRFAQNGDPEQVAVAELAPGDHVLVRAGESIPIDGVVVAGRSSVSESVLTGESLPVAKQLGDNVIGGSINIDSPLTVRVERTGADTVLSSVLRLLDRAQAGKPRLMQLADRVAAWFVLAVLALAGSVGAFWWQHDPAFAVTAVIAVLVVTCPCALGLATPTALSAATGALARGGLLATRGHALETLARATHFVFDKTGTLTQGVLCVNRIYVFNEIDADRSLRLAAALERRSEHPIGRAIVTAARGGIPTARDVQNHPGAGLEGFVDGRHLYLGTPSFVERSTGFAISPHVLARLCGNGGTVVALATSDGPLALFALEDSIRPDAVDTIAALKRLGRQVVLLTGDNAHAAGSVARIVGIENVHAELRPDDKLSALRRLQRDGAVVAMIGDGINDAPVLAAAEVSIAVANAAQISAAAADMILLTPALRQIVTGFDTARRTLAVVRQNLAWASAYNLLAVPAAAAGLVTPWIAALGMSASSALVVLNALRLVKTPRAYPSEARRGAPVPLNAQGGSWSAAGVRFSSK